MDAKKIIAITFFIALVVMLYIGLMPNKIGGPCEYGDVDEEVVLYKIDRESSYTKWCFTGIRGEAYRIRLPDFKRTNIDFDTAAAIGDRYIFQGSKRILGGCPNFFIRSFNKLDSRAHLPITPPK